MIDPYPRLMRAAGLVGLVVGPTSVVGGAILRGWAGAWTATGTILLVVGGFLLTAWSLRWAGRRGPTTVQAVALGGMILKLSAYGLLLAVLAPLDVVDPPTLAVTAPVALVVLLVTEVRLVTSNPEFRMIHSTPAWARDGKDHV